MKAIKCMIGLACALLLSACQAASGAAPQTALAPVKTERAAPTALTTATSITIEPGGGETQILHTAAGDLEISGWRYVDEIHGAKPGDGEKILLITLVSPGGAFLDPTTFSLESFQAAIQDTSNGGVHLEGDDGSFATSSMAGWLDDRMQEFGMGFRVPATTMTFKLFWPGNAPIEISG